MQEVHKLDDDDDVVFVCCSKKKLKKKQINKDSVNAYDSNFSNGGGLGYFSNTGWQLSLKNIKKKIDKAKPISALLLSWYLHQSHHSKVSTSVGDELVWFPNPLVRWGPCLVKD